MDTQDCGPEILPELPDEEVESGGGKVNMPSMEEAILLIPLAVAMVALTLTVGFILYNSMMPHPVSMIYQGTHYECKDSSYTGLGYGTFKECTDDNGRIVKEINSWEFIIEEAGK